jgi:hypothetical protein
MSTECDPLDAVISRYRGREIEPVAPRKPGRPLKRTPAYYGSVLAALQRARDWYVASRGVEPRSELALLTAYFESVFEATGERAGRARSPQFKGALKTFRNELAEARRLAKACPENFRFLGTSPSVE